jgi:hypothetical protein
MARDLPLFRMNVARMVANVAPSPLLLLKIAAFFGDFVIVESR